MSIKVNIEHDEGRFQRTIEISRSAIDDENGNDLYAVNRYNVKYRGGSGKTYRDTVIEHRYGDDLLTLFDEAVKALGGLGGPGTTGLVR